MVNTQISDISPYGKPSRRFSKPFTRSCCGQNAGHDGHARRQEKDSAVERYGRERPDRATRRNTIGTVPLIFPETGSAASCGRKHTTICHFNVK